MADTTHDPVDNRIVQLAVFLPNRLGALLSMSRVLESRSIAIRALSIAEAADYAVARLIVDQPTLAASSLRQEGYSLVETELLGVVLSGGGSVQGLLQAILVAELNVHYLYSMIEPKRGQMVLAICVEAPAAAAEVLVDRNFRLVDQSDLS